MAGQADSEFRSVAITETSRNVVCLILNVFQRGDCLDFDRILDEALSSFLQREKRKSHLRWALHDLARVQAKLSVYISLIIG